MITIMDKKTRKTGRHKTTYFFMLITEGILHFKEQKLEKTASNYACALNHLMQFRKEKDIPVEDLTVLQMRDFQCYMKSKRLKMNTISLYSRMLNAVYNYALNEEIITADKRPFRKNFTGQEKTRKRTLDEKTVKQMIKINLAGNKALEFARDMFLFSVYMQKMPFVDIAHLTKAQILNRQITYQRRKTNGRLTVTIHPHAKAIIDKWQENNRACPYLFPILYNSDNKKVVKYSNALAGLTTSSSVTTGRPKWFTRIRSTIGATRET